MALLTIITMLAIIEYIYFGMKVGKARGEYGIDAVSYTHLTLPTNREV